MERIIN